MNDLTLNCSQMIAKSGMLKVCLFKQSGKREKII